MRLKPPGIRIPAARRHRRLVPRGRLAWLTGVFSTLLLAQHAVLVPAAVPLALLKLMLPFAAVRRRVDPLLNGIATAGSAATAAGSSASSASPGTQGNTGLRYADWYLVNCNHQSWVDIFVLQATLNRRIPLLKFFSSSSSSTCR